MSVSKDHYYKLGSDIQQERIQAATALLSELSKADSKDEWDYALKRLVKGLTTSRQTARFGFSMALTELVRELVLKEDHDLSISSYLDKVLEASSTSSSMKGKELRSVLFGRLFGFQALVNSSLLLDPQASSKATVVKFVKLLVELSSAKSWLRESAMFTLCQFFSSYLNSSLADDNTTAAFLQAVGDEGLVFTTEGLAVYLTVPKSTRQSVVSLLTSTSQWKNNDPMSKGNLPTLAKVLKDVEVVEDPENQESASTSGPKGSKQKSTWSSRIPFVWDLLLTHYINEDSDNRSGDIEKISKKRKKSTSAASKKSTKSDFEQGGISLKDFWKVVIDETMFAERASVERKYWGFEIFNKFFVALPGSKIKCLFTPNFMRCLINQSAQSSRLLNKLSTKTINCIIKTCQTDLSKVMPSLLSIIDESEGGCWNFDPMTKSKTTDALIGVLGYLEDPEQISNSVVENLVLEIQSLLLAKFRSGLQTQQKLEHAPSGDVSAKYSNDNILKWCLDKLLVLFRSTKRYSADFTESMDNLFKFLLEMSFFKPKNGPQLSQHILKLTQERLNAFLSESLSKKRKDRSWSSYCVKQLRQLEDNEDFQLLLDFSPELEEIKSECFDLLHTVKKAMKLNPNTANEQFCFELLFSMLLLELYIGETETVNVLEDLKTTYNDIFSGNSANDVNPSVVLTEILLSFVSRKSKLAKKLSTIVWESFMCATNSKGELNVNESCFELLFNVLGAKENEEGQKKLFEGEEEYDVGEIDEIDNTDGAGNSSEGSNEIDESSNEDHEDSSSEDDYSDEEGNDVNDKAKSKEKVEQETTIKLANALGIPATNDGEVKYHEIDSFGDDDDEYESESMDDEQMMAIDEELSRIFQERRSALTSNSNSKKKAEKTSAKEQMILFKNRILDLLDSFSKTHPNSLYNISFIRPLVGLINVTTDKNLGIKAHKILKTRISKFKCTENELIKVYKTPSEVSDYKEVLLDLVRWLQTQAGTYSSNHAHGSACNQSCIIVAKCLLAIDDQILPELIGVYSQTLIKWAGEPKNRIQPHMFFDFINWLSSKRVKKQS